MKKNFVLALIILLCLLLIIIIVAIYQINNNKVSESDIISLNEDIISNNEERLFEIDNKTSQIEYDKSQLEDIDMDLIVEVMATDENIEYILDNEDAIKTKIKEYILLNNINDASSAIFETYQIKNDSDMIAVLFILDNKKETELIVIMDKKNNSINVKEK